MEDKLYNVYGQTVRNAVFRVVARRQPNWRADVEALEQEAFIGGLIGLRAYKRRLTDPRGTLASERTYVYRNAVLYCKRALERSDPKVIFNSEMIATMSWEAAEPDEQEEDVIL